jgi:hypothetical protein
MQQELQSLVQRKHNIMFMHYNIDGTMVHHNFASICWAFQPSADVQQKTADWLHVHVGLQHTRSVTHKLRMDM